MVATTPFEVVYTVLYARYRSSFVSIQDSADELSIHFTTARAWLSKGCFPLPTVSLGSRRVVSLASLAAFVAGNGQQEAEGEAEVTASEIEVPVVEVAPVDQTAKINTVPAVVEQEKKKRGRPCKMAGAVVLPKRRRGRPSKATVEVRHG